MKELTTQTRHFCTISIAKTRKMGFFVDGRSHFLQKKMTASPCLLSFLILFLLILSGKKVSGGGDKNGERIIVAVLDESSRVGKEQRVAIQAAIEDIYQKTNQSFELFIKDTQGLPSRAALAAAELVNTSGLKVILGPQTWEETSLVAEFGREAQIPVLSFSESIPRWASENWPFLIQASPNQDSQMDAIAGIVESYEWHRVTVIYEDSESSASDVFPHLSDSLQGKGSEIVEFLALQPFPSASISEELQRLKKGHCRVFVVHLSFSLAVRLFEAANKMDMMKRDYVWITTDSVTSFVYSVNASVMASMQGIVGVTPYVPEDQSREFNDRFRQTYPAENNDESGVFSFQAYNIAYGVCLAMLKSNDSQSLAKNLLHKFKDQSLSPVSTYQIINIAENKSITLGFWSKGKGFSKTIGEMASYNDSMKILDQPVWPGGSPAVPKGWSLPPLLRVGVPIKSSFKQLVNVSQVSEKYLFGGFTTTVFAETVRALPYSAPYEFIPFDGTNDELVEQVYLKNFDAAVGELAIVADRYQYVEFTHPYTESALYMIVPFQPVTSNRALLFLKPFTNALWAIIVVITIYNGFVIWLIERNHCPELKGSIANQMGTLVASAFTTLFSLHGERQHSNLSRMSMVVWLFVALIITQTYTANLASILTADLLKPSVADIELLRTKNLKVGFYRDSFVKRFLVDVLHFRDDFITSYNSPEEYALALGNKSISAVFMEAPFAKLFLAEHCKRFTKAGPTFRIGGFGFVLPRRSPFLHDLNKALLNISEAGTLDDIETKMIGSSNSNGEEITSLSPSSFWLLFALTGSTSTIALIVYIFRCDWSLLESASGRKTLSKLIFVALKRWGGKRMRVFRQMKDSRRDGNHSNGANLRDRV